MTKQLYEEALADVKKLKEVAEDNAKRALLEAVTPRIRDLIENQLLGEMGVDEIEADPEDILKDTAAEYPVPSSMSEPACADAGTPAISVATPEEQVPVNVVSLDALSTGDELELDSDEASQLGMAYDKKMPPTFEGKLRHLQNKVSLFGKLSKLVSEGQTYRTELSTLISEVEDTYSYLQNNLQDSPKKSSYESILENYYSNLKQLMEQKMKNKKTLSEADITLKLTGLPDEVEDALENIGVDLITGEEGEEEGDEEGGDELDLDGDDEGEKEGGDDLDLGGGGGEDSDEDLEEEGYHMESKRLSDDTVVEIDENMLRREIGRMKALREAADMPKNAEKGNGPGEVADGFEDDDLGDPFTDIKLRESGDVKKELEEMDLGELEELEQAYGEGKMDLGELEELEQAYGEGDDMKRQATDHSDDPQSNKQNRMPTESLRRKIAAEIALQTEAKNKANQAKKRHSESKAQEKKEKTTQGKKAAKKTQAKLKEAYAYYATKFNESVARTNKLKGMLAEATRRGAVLNGGATKSAAETDLRNKLAETNLFNAKLLFTNKLLQNESLTKRQKAEVIERLDEAKSEREVKLVYESLVKTLTASTNKLTESADRGVIGSSSRPARPASATNTLNEGFEADRWARLAGIIK
jgi:hypothetical protein